MDSQQPQHNEHQGPQPDLVSLWEQMGATTGSLIGRFIGLNAKLGLDTLQGFAINPDNMNPGIRSKVWTEMGRTYGESLGNAIGLAMDSFAKSVEDSVVQPLAEAESGKGDF